MMRPDLLGVMAPPSAAGAAIGLLVGRIDFELLWRSAGRLVVASRVRAEART